MNKEKTETQKKVGFLLALTGFIGFIVNLISFTLTGSLMEALRYFYVYASLIISILFVITALIPGKITKLLQGVIMVGVATISIMDQHDAFDGVLLFLLLFFLAFEYNWFDKRIILKIVLFSAYYLSLVITSISLESGFTFSLVSINALSSAVVFILILLMIHRKRISQLKIKSKNTIGVLLEQKIMLEKEIEFNSDKLAKLNAQIVKYREKNKPTNLSNISSAELRVLEALCIYRETDRDIGRRLNITEGTVGVHLQRIRDKLGVDNKLELIELCRNNFI